MAESDINGQPPTLVTAGDIADLQQARERADRLSMILRAIRNVNQLITKVENPQRLIEGSCANLTESLAYHNAWIAMLDESGTMTASAQSGLDGKFDRLHEQLRQGRFTDCMRRVLDSDQVLTVIEPPSECPDCPLSVSYNGYAGLARQLVFGCKTYGVIVASVPAQYAAIPEEQSLFGELADDLAFALHKIDMLEHLAESRRRCDAIFEGSRDGFVMIDTTGRIIEANHAFCDMLGYSIGELRGMEGFHTITPERWRDWERTEIWQKRLLVQGESGLYEKEYIRKDGTVFPVELQSYTVRDDAGRIEYLWGSARDITVRKQAEADSGKLRAQLNHSQRMESVGRLAGGVAHDFNNQLMGIMGYTELCLDTIKEDHPAFEWLNEIKQGAQRSANLTRQLLAFARKQTITPQPLDLNEAVGSMLKMLCRLIGEHLELKWAPATGLWPVNVDPGQMDQILANLCVNSRDAIDKDGRIMIETGNVTVTTDYCRSHAYFTPGDYVMLAVSDNGCGMDQQTQEHLFEPFFTTKGVGKGTGLGLATVYGIVKQNGGFINAYSEPGLGTTFRIYLPRFEGIRPCSPETEVVTERPGGSETVLLVEDEMSIRRTLTMFLEQLGYRVISAESADDALIQAAKQGDHIDILITDVVMPGMSGRELADRLTSVSPSLKVLFMSGYTANAIAHHGILDSGVDFLSKPFSRDTVAHAVRKVLDRDRQDTLYKRPAYP